MIVLSMSYKEIYDCLETDMPKLDYQREKLLPKISKAFQAENQFPNYKWVEYKPSSGTQYLILYCAQNSLEIDDPRVRYCALVWNGNYRYVVTWMMSDYKHPTMNTFEKTPMIYAYTKHFFEQYNNRFLKNPMLSANDVVCRFLMRNYTYTPIEVNKKINRNIEYKDNSYKRGFCIRDGVCFTRFDIDGEFPDIDEIGNDKVYALCFVFTTYMNQDEMSQEQNEAIEKENQKSWELFFMHKGNL